MKMATKTLCEINRDIDRLQRTYNYFANNLCVDECYRIQEELSELYEQQRIVSESMKVWDIDDFIAECRLLAMNQYTYDYSRMPEGVCNGHHVEAYMGSWQSIAIDGVVVNMWLCTDKNPEGMGYFLNGEEMSIFDYIRRKLMPEV
jgi:hypothetical protein